MLDITERTVGHVTVLQLSGRLVVESRETPFLAAVDRLAQQDRIHVVLDMRDVAYIDSAGLGFLVAKLVSLRRRGGDLRLVRLTERSLRLLTITRLTTVFAIFESVEAAVGSFQTS